GGRDGRGAGRAPRAQGEGSRRHSRGIPRTGGRVRQAARTSRRRLALVLKRRETLNHRERSGRRVAADAAGGSPGSSGSPESTNGRGDSGDPAGIVATHLGGKYCAKETPVSR